MKYLVVIVVVALALWLTLGRRPRVTRQSQPRSKEPEDMVGCAHCGVLLPDSEALRVGDLRYCCPAHRAAGPGKT